MSAKPDDNKAPDLIGIEIDGNATRIRKGAMIIEAADAIGVTIPRFCYHRKLPIAANCRMCLVEVEMGGKKMPKPQPACATPVADGMKVSTRSDFALKAQRNVMEFLLINHPLDCPICDQGGECELQDLSLGFGRSVSRFTERKRTLGDENIGPLVATEMTRCIHCTRCVRFTSEIAASYELGGMGRTEDLEIGTWVGKVLETELSGNVIDLCPVGALTNKPFQFRARAWEMVAKPSIGYHDALGSNLWLHTRRGEVLRTVPRDNESINECWLSDRDRYSYQGLYAQDRLAAPQVKRDGQWQRATWDEALGAAAEALGSAGSDLGVLLHPATSVEEGDLLRRLAAALGTGNLDHRLRQLDFADNATATRFEMPVAAVPAVQAALLVGSDLRHEMPLLNHRLHQAVKKGAAVFAVNPAGFDFNYVLAGQSIVPPQAMVDAMLALAAAAVGEGPTAPPALAEAIAGAVVDDGDRGAIAALKKGPSVIILGEAAVTHPQASWLRALSRFIAGATDSSVNELPVGANAVGLAELGVVPQAGGLDAHAMLAQPRGSYVLYGVEPPHDFADGAAALKALRGARRVVAFSAFAGPELLEVADVILPISLLPEMDATLVNVEGMAQTLGAGARAPAEGRAGWKVLRALGGHMQLAGFEFDDLTGLREGIRSASVPRADELAVRESGTISLSRLATWPIYRSDAVLRRATALNAHPLNRAPAFRVNGDQLEELGLTGTMRASLGEVVLPVVVDPLVPMGTVWIEAAHALTATLPAYGTAITLSKV